MFTTGSKFLVGASVVAVLAAVIYGVTQDGVMGTVGLASAAVGLVGLATLNALLRDSNVFADDDAPVETTAAARYPPTASIWPLGFAFGAAIVAVGLTSYQPIVVIGLAVLLIAGAEWAVQAWSERASGNVDHNAEVRSRVSNPLEYPVGGAVAIGVIIYAFSRVMLSVTSEGTVVVFGVIGAVVVAVAFVFASRRSLKSGALGGSLALGAIVVVAAGTAAGLGGQRTIPEYETTAVYQEESIEHPEDAICESPEEFYEADENASQTVAAKSGAYEVLLRADDTLDFDVPGSKGAGIRGITLPRSNATNVIFRNESNEDRRLTLDLGPETVTVGEGDEAEDVETRRQLCTTLVESGGAQLLTVVAGEASFAFADEANPNGPDGEGGFWFFVPGVESAKLELIVP